MVMSAYLLMLCRICEPADLRAFSVFFCSLPAAPRPGTTGQALRAPRQAHKLAASLKQFDSQQLALLRAAAAIIASREERMEPLVSETKWSAEAKRAPPPRTSVSGKGRMRDLLTQGVAERQERELPAPAWVERLARDPRRDAQSPPRISMSIPVDTTTRRRRGHAQAEADSYNILQKWEEDQAVFNVLSTAQARRMSQVEGAAQSEQDQAQYANPLEQEQPQQYAQQQHRVAFAEGMLAEDDENGVAAEAAAAWGSGREHPHLPAHLSGASDNSDAGRSRRSSVDERQRRAEDLLDEFGAEEVKPQEQQTQGGGRRTLLRSLTAPGSNRRTTNAAAEFAAVSASPAAAAFGLLADRTNGVGGEWRPLALDPVGEHSGRRPPHAGGSASNAQLRAALAALSPGPTSGRLSESRPPPESPGQPLIGPFPVARWASFGAESVSEPTQAVAFQPPPRPPPPARSQSWRAPPLAIPERLAAAVPSAVEQPAQTSGDSTTPVGALHLGVQDAPSGTAFEQPQEGSGEPVVPAAAPLPPQPSSSRKGAMPPLPSQSSLRRRSAEEALAEPSWVALDAAAAAGMPSPLSRSNSQKQQQQQQLSGSSAHGRATVLMPQRSFTVDSENSSADRSVQRPADRSMSDSGKGFSGGEPSTSSIRHSGATHVARRKSHCSAHGVLVPNLPDPVHLPWQLARQPRKSLAGAGALLPRSSVAGPSGRRVSELGHRGAADPARPRTTGGVGPWLGAEGSRGSVGAGGLGAEFSGGGVHGWDRIDSAPSTARMSRSAEDSRQGRSRTGIGGGEDDGVEHFPPPPPTGGGISGADEEEQAAAVALEHASSAGLWDARRSDMQTPDSLLDSRAQSAATPLRSFSATYRGSRDESGPGGDGFGRLSEHTERASVEPSTEPSADMPAEFSKRLLMETEASLISGEPSLLRLPAVAAPAEAPPDLEAQTEAETPRHDRDRRRSSITWIELAADAEEVSTPTPAAAPRASQSQHSQHGSQRSGASSRPSMAGSKNWGLSPDGESSGGHATVGVPSGVSGGGGGLFMLQLRRNTSIGASSSSGDLMTVRLSTGSVPVSPADVAHHLATYAHGLARVVCCCWSQRAEAVSIAFVLLLTSQSPSSAIVRAACKQSFGRQPQSPLVMRTTSGRRPGVDSYLRGAAAAAAAEHAATTGHGAADAVATPRPAPLPRQTSARSPGRSLLGAQSLGSSSSPRQAARRTNSLFSSGESAISGLARKSAATGAGGAEPQHISHLLEQAGERLPGGPSNLRPISPPDPSSPLRLTLASRKSMGGAFLSSSLWSDGQGTKKAGQW